MIKYRLICKDCETTFDSWFSSSKEYERLKKKNFLNCHACNSLNIEKTLMSPSVFTRKNDPKTDNQIQKYKRTKEVISKYQEIFYKVFVYTDKNFSKHFEDYNKKISKDQLVTHRDLLKKLKERDVSGFQDLMLKHLTLYVDFIDSNAENTN